MLHEETQLMALVSNEKLRKADAIICLEGDDDYLRADKSLELFRKKLSSVIVVLGKKEIEDYLVKEGVKKGDIIGIFGSKDTHEEAANVIKKAKEKGWKSIIIVTSTFHQPRAFLTFLRAMKNEELLHKIQIFNAPASHPWFDKMKSAQISRWDLLLGIQDLGEFEKIKEYQEKGHLVPIKEAIEYQQWKEKQP